MIIEWKVRNRFKGLDVIDRVADEQWMEVHYIVQETGIKTIPKKEKCRKAKWLSEDTLQISVKKKRSEKQRRKGKIYPFECRVSKRDKKAFISNQCKEIEENNRTGKNRDRFKKLEISRDHFMQRWAQ